MILYTQIPFFSLVYKYYILSLVIVNKGSQPAQLL